jgi:hypothetical protein
MRPQEIFFIQQKNPSLAVLPSISATDRKLEFRKLTSWMVDDFRFPVSSESFAKNNSSSLSLQPTPPPMGTLFNILGFCWLHDFWSNDIWPLGRQAFGRQAFGRQAFVIQSIGWKAFGLQSFG